MFICSRLLDASRLSSFRQTRLLIYTFNNRIASMSVLCLWKHLVKTVKELCQNSITALSNSWKKNRIVYSVILSVFGHATQDIKCIP